MQKNEIHENGIEDYFGDHDPNLCIGINDVQQLLPKGTKRKQFKSIQEQVLYLQAQVDSMNNIATAVQKYKKAFKKNQNSFIKQIYTSVQNFARWIFSLFVTKTCTNANINNTEVNSARIDLLCAINKSINCDVSGKEIEETIADNLDNPDERKLNGIIKNKLIYEKRSDQNKRSYCPFFSIFMCKQNKNLPNIDTHLHISHTSSTHRKKVI